MPFCKTPAASAASPAFASAPPFGVAGANDQPPCQRGPAVDPGDSPSALPHLDVAWTDLVDRTMAAVHASVAKPDLAFGEFAPIVSLVRSVTYHDGMVLEAGLDHLVRLNPNLIVVPLARPLPVVPAAIEVIRKNGWKDLSAIQLSSEVHARSSYMPDMLLVDAASGSALLVDLKRGLSGHSEAKRSRLRERMMAAALITSDWLHVEGCAPAISSVSIAIIDGSNEHSDHAKGLFSISEIDGLIGVKGAGEAMARLRTIFATRIQAAMEQACRAVVKPVNMPAEVASTNALPERDDDLFSDGRHVPPGSRYSGGQSFVDLNDKRSAWRRVSVGFARAVPD